MDNVIPAKRMRMSVSQEEDQRRVTHTYVANSSSNPNVKEPPAPVSVISESTQAAHSEDDECLLDLQYSDGEESQSKSHNSDDDSEQGRSTHFDRPGTGSQYLFNILREVNEIVQETQQLAFVNSEVEENRFPRLDIVKDLRKTAFVKFDQCSGCQSVIRVFECIHCGTGQFCSKECLEKDWEAHAERCSPQIKAMIRAHAQLPGYCHRRLMEIIVRLTDCIMQMIYSNLR